MLGEKIHSFIKYLTAIAFVFLSAFYYTYATSPSCSVVPFSKSVKQGESVNFAVSLVSGSASNPFSLYLNPGVDFEGVNFSQSNGVVVPSEVTLSLSAKTFSTPGSYNLVVQFSQGSEASEKNTCQLNIIIIDNPAHRAATLDSIGISTGLGSGSSVQSTAEPTVETLNSTSSESEINVETDSQDETSEDKEVKDLKKINFSFSNFILKKGVRIGERSDGVKLLQEILKAEGLFPEDEEPTGYFGPLTEEGVKKFQELKGLEQVGIVGPKTLEELRAVFNSASEEKNSDDLTQSSFSRKLERGMRGDDIFALQYILKELALFPEDEEPTGYFGPLTEEGVKKFQELKGLEQVGIVGPKTRNELNIYVR